ncbi:DUF1508 domain-containing protein [Amycolatopsis rhabdoformis]|uniref:DUF1508 domain-containing protein n=1 Tax=Amycolatopsis rhabdoformis TaxID=1448059 RepID=A0ABZ1IDT2_9PSEU|nr:DUF1508 domain-containing protein [Amycolatopsis rhabdoformis]WSE32624.1 DUF1508 domain-containing protein [Amycolatopsis rhabdoformis]
MLGSNNASLGLGAVDYRSAEECVAAIRWLCTNLPRTRLELVHDHGIDWRWVLRAGATPVAIASHAYGRRIEATRGHDRFVTAMRQAAEFAADGRIVDGRTKYGTQG